MEWFYWGLALAVFGLISAWVSKRERGKKLIGSEFAVFFSWCLVIVGCVLMINII